MPRSAQDVQKMFRRFRILVVGRANAGKTTLLQKVCNTAEKPEILDGKGNKAGSPPIQRQNHLLINREQINADAVQGSVDVCTHVL
jgi:septin family protein